jgi:ribonuclease BN (tRNA processing enzyme)
MKIETLKDRELKLANKGSLELFFVGVGSAFTKRHYQTNLMIVKGKDHLLIDCGTKTPQALSELGLSVTDISNYLITHSHADHIGGLEEVALVNRYMARKKPVMVIDETYQHILWDMSLRGGCSYNEEEASIMLSFGDFFDVIRPRWLQDYKRETLGAKVGDLGIKMMRTKHIPDSSEDWQSSFWSCGVILDDRVFFTSDTRYDKDLVMQYEEMFNFEAIFHDCQFFTGGVHASLEELKALPLEVKQKMHLTHYGDNWEDFQDRVRDYGFAGLAEQQVFYVFD